jgi:hypothetical protein
MELLMPYQVNLKTKDQNFVELQEVIKLKREFLLNKQKKMKEIKKNNHFLEEIKNDYSKYSDYIMNQKQEQIKALDLLKNYVDDLTTSGDLSDENIKDAKHEQKKIISEINKIKENLNEIIGSDEL